MIDPTPLLPSLRRGAEREITVARKGRRPDRERVADSLDEGRAAMGPPMLVPNRISDPHPLVASALSLLAHAKQRNGLAVCRDERCLDIAVSPGLLSRAARIMNTLILGLEERGLPVEVTDVLIDGAPDHAALSNVTRVLVRDAWIRFGFVERLQQHRSSPTIEPPRGLKGDEREFWLHCNRPRVTLIPSGKLLLVIKEPEVGVQVSWADGRRRIEARLNDFVKQLFVVAEAKKQTHKADHTWRETFEVESRRNREERERAEAEARRIEALREMLARWKEVRDVRELVHELRTTRHEREQSEWLDWVDAYATRIELELRGDG
ncbi:MAG TPA: hypothetical protein VGG74_01470 [Kofleriaceae bacterium]|jgi:hypothetical protein